MKLRTFTSMILLLAVAACNQNPEKKAPAEYPATDPQLGVIRTDTSRLSLDETEKCFTANVKKDSAFISLKNIGGNIEGKLWYKFAEKDNSKGTLKGTLDQDTLKLNYTFKAEGSTSEMPIKLYHKNGNLYEVYGDKTAEEGKGFIYIPSNCKNF